MSDTAVAIEVLRLYTSVLCNPLDPSPLTKFAKAVTNKVRGLRHSSACVVVI